MSTLTPTLPTSEPTAESQGLLETRRFKALQGDWPPEELGHFFWLTPDDLLQVCCAGYFRHPTTI
jgi:hypothetical protein